MYTQQNILLEYMKIKIYFIIQKSKILKMIIYKIVKNTVFFFEMK